MSLLRHLQHSLSCIVLDAPFTPRLTHNDLYCVEWGVKLYSSQPTNILILTHRGPLRVRQSLSSHDQLRATSLIVRNVFTWCWALCSMLHSRPVVIIMSTGTHTDSPWAAQAQAESQRSCKFLYFCSRFVLSCISFVVLYFPVFSFITVLGCVYSFTLEVQRVFSIKRYSHQLVSVYCSWVWYAQKYVADIHNSAKCAFG